MITTPVINLFQDLEQGACAITATRTLARQVEQRYAGWKSRQGETAWPTPSVLSYDDWLFKLWRSVFEHQPGAPSLLTDDQELLLWERVIRGAGLTDGFLFQLSNTARVARKTWGRIHEWQLDWRSLEDHKNADTEAFLGWAKAFRSSLQDNRWLTSAQLPEYLLAHHGARLDERYPPSWWMGFDVWPANHEAIWNLLKAHGIRQNRFENAGTGNTDAAVIECTDSGEQWGRIACWARSELAKDPAGMLGVVCPELHNRRDEIEEVLEDVLHPELAWQPDAPRAYHLSLGRPLSDYPVVKAALDLLHWSDHRIPFDVLSRTLRSPYLSGSSGDPEPWVGFELLLRKHRQETFSLTYLHTLAVKQGNLDGFASSLESVHALQWPERTDPATWAIWFSEWLQALGWPGKRSLNSHEFQTLNAWHETLSRFAALNTVQDRWTRSDALKRISSMAAARILQFHDHQAPLQVIGASESSGIWFDKIWLADMSDAVWPPSAQPDPFIPVSLQKERGMPAASPQSTLEHARLCTGNWLASAAQARVSFTRRDADAPRSLSPLFTGLTTAASEYKNAYTGRVKQLERSGPELDVVPEHRAPEVKSGPLPGGVSLLADQAKCPFRALAHHRLNARALREVVPGLDAGERGTMVHSALSSFWNRLGTLETLNAMKGGALRALIRECVTEALQQVFADSPFKKRFLELERDRLESLLSEWLELEKHRDGFKVVGTEIETRTVLGDVEFRVRVDRVDELANGRHMIIDYKTGKTAAAVSWSDPRPEDPQLPMYALSMDRDLAALVVASVGRGRCAMRGVGEGDDDVSFPRRVGKLESVDIEQLKTRWRSVLRSLVNEHKQGVAWVEPKHPRICRLCDVMPLCRIFERSAFVDEG